MTPGSARRRRSRGVGGCTALLASKTAMSAWSIRYRGLPFRSVLALIALSSPALIQCKTLATSMPHCFASSGGVIFIRVEAATGTALPPVAGQHCRARAKQGARFLPKQNVGNHRAKERRAAVATLPAARSGQGANLAAGRFPRGKEDWAFVLTLHKFMESNTIKRSTPMYSDVFRCYRLRSDRRFFTPPEISGVTIPLCP